MMIESSSSLNNATIPFLILSRFGLFALIIAASPSSLYKPTPLLSKTALQQVKSNKFINFGSIIRSHQNIKQLIISFLYPCRCFIEKERFIMMIILITESLKVVIDLENEMEQLSSSSDIDG